MGTVLWAPYGCHAGDWNPIFKLNTALIKISNYAANTSLLLRSDKCEGCAFRTECVMHGDSTSLLASSVYPMHINIPRGDGSVCEKAAYLENLGTWALDVGNCNLTTIDPGEDQFWTWFIIVAGITSLLFVHDIYLFFENGFSPKQTDAGEFNFGNIPRKLPAKRLLSVSVFRGLMVFATTFMNSMSGGKTPLLHSEWDGFTVADFEYPAFLFCAGLSTQLAISYKTTVDWSGFFKRQLYLSLIGVFIVNGGLDWNTVRVTGVLQRIAVCAIILFPLQAWQNRKQEDLCRMRAEKLGLPDDEEDVNGNGNIEKKTPDTDGAYNLRRRNVTKNGGPATGSAKHVQESPPSFLWSSYGEWSTISAVLFVTAILNVVSFLARYYPIEGCPSGYVGVGGLGDGGRYPHCTGGVYAAFDRWLFGDHGYKSAFCKRVWQCLDVDSEGVLTTAGSLINVATGIHVAQILRWYPTREEQNDRLIRYGILYGIVGYALTFVMPINKQIWSQSYAFTAASLCVFLYYVIRNVFDREESYFKMRMLAYMGDNSMLIFTLQEGMKFRLPYHFYMGYTNFAWACMALYTTVITIIFTFIARSKGWALRL